MSPGPFFSPLNESKCRRNKAGASWTPQAPSAPSVAPPLPGLCREFCRWSRHRAAGRLDTDIRQSGVWIPALGYSLL